jgi:hypothetical protein
MKTALSRGFNEEPGNRSVAGFKTNFPANVENTLGDRPITVRSEWSMVRSCGWGHPRPRFLPSEKFVERGV